LLKTGLGSQSGMTRKPDLPMNRQAIGSHTEIVDPASVSSDEADDSPLQSANSPAAIHVAAMQRFTNAPIPSIST
jgi:hypothetical protein